MRLIDANVLKEEITSNCYFGLEPVIEKEVLRMIDEQETILVKPPKWISVKDRLPNFGQIVLVYSGEELGIGFAYFYGDGKWSGDCGDVTHWMPLPEPPEVEDVQG